MKLDIRKLETGRILNYAIDPYNGHKLLKRELKEISKHLEGRFQRGYKLLNDFKKHISINDYGSNFKKLEVHSRYDLLNNLMSNRPSNMVSKLKKFYRVYHKGEQTHNRKHPLKRTELDNKYIELCLYTHKWRQTVEKKNSKENKHFYELLKNTKFTKCDFIVQNNPNQNNNFHSIFQRQKSKNSIIEKLTSKTIEDIDTVNIYPERFYRINYNMRDLFAMRICSPRLNRGTRSKINELLTYEGQIEKNLNLNLNDWISVAKIDYTTKDNININHIKHYLRTPKYPLDSIIEVQFSTLEDLLLDEFFTASGHLLKERKRKNKIKKKRRKNGNIKEIKKRINDRLNLVLDFLP